MDPNPYKAGIEWSKIKLNGGETSGDVPRCSRDAPGPEPQLRGDLWKRPQKESVQETGEHSCLNLCS